MSNTPLPGIHGSIAREVVRASVERRPWPRWIATSLCWTYSILMGVLVLGLWFAPIEAWPLTLFGYGPRWLVASPLLFLLPLGLFTGRRNLLGVALGILLLPATLGMVVPWPLIISTEETGPRLRVLTCNITGRHSDVNKLHALLRETHPDVVLLQECNIEDMSPYLSERGWNIVVGAPELLIASRTPIQLVEQLDLPGDGRGSLALKAIVSWKGHAVRVVNLHASSLRGGFDSLLHRDPDSLDAFKTVALRHNEEARKISEWVDRTQIPLVVAGDFNAPVDNPTYRDYWGDLENAYSAAGWGVGSTYSTRLIRLRIDHVLAGRGWVARQAWVGPTVDSQHFPVIVDLEWTGSRGAG